MGTEDSRTGDIKKEGKHWGSDVQKERGQRDRQEGIGENMYENSIRQSLPLWANSEEKEKTTFPEVGVMVHM